MERKSDDPVDFDRLVAAHQKRLLLIAYQICGHLEDARDIVQDTFLRAFRYRNALRADRKPGAWLNRIAVNAALDHLRRRRRDRAVPLDQLEGLLPDRSVSLAPAPSAEEHLAARGETDRLFRLLDRLAPRERAAFVLRYLQGLSTAEVARAMGCTRVTVRRHSLRAREKLRAALQTGRQRPAPAARKTAGEPVPGTPLAAAPEKKLS